MDSHAHVPRFEIARADDEHVVDFHLLGVRDLRLDGVGRDVERGTHERFIGFLIEHYAGNFPLWLSPEQVRILPFGDDPPLVESARALQAELRAAGVRATLDASTDPIKAKIANAEQMKVHHMLVIGPRDLAEGKVSVRIHGKGNLGAMPTADVVAEILAAIKERRA